MVDKFVNRFLNKTQKPPVMEVRSWLEKHEENKLEIINLSQAAPLSPPPKSLIKHLSKELSNTDSHLYGPVLGDYELRSKIATDWSDEYESKIMADNVAVTSGCNQAFCAAISSIATAGDKIILPVPWYFNHEMWLSMQGIIPIPLPTNENLLPCIKSAKALIDDKVKAIVLVTPNNPTGVEYPDDLLKQFNGLVRKNKIKLILDETYKNFRQGATSPHSLFKNKWEGHLIHLYSFSKVYRLTGHRVGMLIASRKLIQEIEKFLDTTSICPNRLGQKAALFGLQNLNTFVEHEKIKIENIKKIFIAGLKKIPGWTLLGIGGYFAYLSYESRMNSTNLAKKLLYEQSILTIPGSMFFPREKNSFIKEKQSIRIAFANSTEREIKSVLERLSKFAL